MNYLFDTIIIGDDMDIYDINKSTLGRLYEMFPDTFKGMSLKDHCLIYKDKSVDLTSFNINDIIVGNSLFGSDLGKLKPIDVFTIIQLHVDFLGGINDGK